MSRLFCHVCDPRLQRPVGDLRALLAHYERCHATRWRAVSFPTPLPQPTPLRAAGRAG